MPEKVTPIGKKKPKFEGCSFCGIEPDHPGYWQCPRIRSVSMDGEAWIVEFWQPKEETDGTETTD